MQLNALADQVVVLVKNALGPLVERIAGLEARLSVLGDLRDRVVVVETKAAMPGPAPTSVDVSPLLERMSRLENSPYVGATKELWDKLSETVVTLRERVAALEAKPLLPGVPGDPGKDGADGLGFEDLDIAIEGDRTLVFRFAKGDKEHTSRVVVGWPVYQKNWIQGKAYVPGDVVTWDGSEWACLEATDDGQPGVSKSWYRSVTKGARGKDGINGKDWTPAPVVSIGRPQ